MKYIKLGEPEQVYGKKHLLNSQLNILNAIKKHEEYKKLRDSELALKTDLSKKIASMQSLLSKLEKSMPKPQKMKDIPKSRNILQSEIEEIKAKLAQLK